MAGCGLLTGAQWFEIFRSSGGIDKDSYSGLFCDRVHRFRVASIKAFVDRKSEGEYRPATKLTHHADRAAVPFHDRLADC